MRSTRLLSLVLATSLLLTLALVAFPSASAQSVDEAERDAEQAKEQAEQADGLVDAAVAERDQIETELALTIERVNTLAAELSVVGAGLDRIGEKLGFADVELAGIQNEIELQAVDAYMTVVSSPSVAVVNSASVEKALVAGTVVEDVVTSGRTRVDELIVQRSTLEDLQLSFLAEQDRFAALKADLDTEVEHLAELYDRADAALAEAIRASQAADAAYQEALSAVDLARAREAERKRQEERSTTTTTTPGGPTTTQPPGATTTTSGGSGPWTHPPAVEQWRPLVEEHFPPHRVEEALRIMTCESSGNPNAYNPYSGASGLFQFLASTWASSSPKAGYGGYSVFDPVANTASAAWLANRYEELGHYYWLAWSCRRVL